MGYKPGSCRWKTWGGDKCASLAGLAAWHTSNGALEIHVISAIYAFISHVVVHLTLYDVV